MAATAMLQARTATRVVSEKCMIAFDEWCFGYLNVVWVVED